MKMVGFVHTTPYTIPMVQDFMKRYLPSVSYIHMYNGCVKIDNFAEKPGITPLSNMARYVNFARELEAAGCNLIVSCCSLMSEAVAYAQKVVHIPFIQLDEPIIQAAAAQWKHVAVIASTPYVIPRVEHRLQESATQLGKQVEIEFFTDMSLLQLFNEGRMDEHDAALIDLVCKAARKGVDGILMGQIPFALIEPRLQRLHLDQPILCAGERCYRYIGEMLA